MTVVGTANKIGDDMQQETERLARLTGTDQGDLTCTCYMSLAQELARLQSHYIIETSQIVSN